MLILHILKSVPNYWDFTVILTGYIGSGVVDWKLQLIVIGIFSIFSRCRGLPDHGDLHVQAEEVQPRDVCGHARAGGRGHEVSLRCQRLHSLAGYVISFIHYLNQLLKLWIISSLDSTWILNFVNLLRKIKIEIHWFIIYYSFIHYRKFTEISATLGIWATIIILQNN